MNLIMRKHSFLEKDQNYSLVLGGPLYQIYLRTHLALPPLQQWKLRIVVMCMLAWLPLFIFALKDHVAFGGVQVPFIYDLDVHARFLGSLAILIFAEVIVHQRLRNILLQFINCELVTPEYINIFDKCLSSALRFRNSVVAELLILVIVYMWGYKFWQNFDLIRGDTWYASLVHNQIQFSKPGYWYMYVSLPIYQFILFRWYYRIMLWYRLLWQISKIPLNLNSLHPDKAGGLGFLADSTTAFASIVFAHTVMLAGMVTNRIWHAHASIFSFKAEILSILALLLLVVFTPLFFFTGQMAATKRLGNSKFSMMASKYVNYFSHKWMSKNTAIVLGAADIQSLSDLSGSYTPTREMRLVPFSIHNVLHILLLAALPFLPLMLALLPFADTIRFMLSVFM